MTRKGQVGAGLIEVLITVVVVSIGLLGMASLQFSSMALNQKTYQRLQAVNLAYEIADSIFVNSTQAVDGEYQLNLGGTGVATAGSVAAEDIANWIATANRKLPNGLVVIGPAQAMASAPNVRVYNITICWADSAGNLNLPNTCGAQDSAMFNFSASSRI